MFEQMAAVSIFVACSASVCGVGCHDAPAPGAPPVAPGATPPVTTTSGAIATIAATVSAATATASATPAAPSSPSSADWSPTVNGLRGRMIATAVHDANGRPQVQLDLQLENVSDSALPISVGWGNISSVLKLSLENEAGAPLPIDAVGGNEMSMPPHWLSIPVDSSVHMRMTKGAYEYVPGGRTMFRPFTFQAWDVPTPRTGKLYVRGKLTPIDAAQIKEPKDSIRRPWVGTLALPRVALP